MGTPVDWQNKKQTLNWSATEMSLYCAIDV